MSAKLIFLAVVLVGRSKIVYSFWLFSCPRGNHNGLPGDECSAFCQCRSPFVCEAFRQQCGLLSKHSEVCHLTKPCEAGLSCQPGVQRCFNVPRSLHEPCSLGFPCGPALSCAPGFQVCNNHPRRFGQPCGFGYPCRRGLSCHPGLQKCYHALRAENEPCSLGYGCSRGLTCTFCARPLATCQLSQVPAFSEQDYQKPYNKVAFLVTHNSYSYGIEFGIWVHNQRFDVTKQLNDGVRGLMLDIYPGWNDADIRLCHGSCFWSGSSNLLHTLIDIRKFLDANVREVVTIFFEDYIRNPSLLAKVFYDANISHHVLPSEYWGSGNQDWPSLEKMASLGHRLVVFSNVGMTGFPYTELNMWNFLIENRYGSKSKNVKECEERGESKHGGDQRSLALVNWFTTISNPVTPCLNDLTRIKQKLETCHDKFGRWPNFLAVDYYSKGSNGGTFKVVQWLNQKLRAEIKVTKANDFIDLFINEIDNIYQKEPIEQQKRINRKQTIK